jgi:hypothetical protein
VSTAGSYADPGWITSLGWSKITGKPSVSSYQTPWLSDISAAGFALVGAGQIEIQQGNYLLMRPTGNTWDMRLQATKSPDRLDVVSGGAPGSPIASFVHGGNVGIGTASPGAPLTVIGSGDVQIRLSNDPANYYTIGRRASDGWLVFSCNQFSATGYDFRTDSGTRSAFRIENNGEIAMSSLPTTAPAAGSKKLWVDLSDGNRVKYAI